VNPALGRVAPTAIEIPLGDGAALHGCVWAASAPRGLVAIVHGLGEHAGRYGAFASDLVESRSTVASFDWPGHGRSSGPRGDASWIDVRERVVPALLRALRAAAPAARPLRLFGHSMGGVMALDYALAHPDTIDAVVASAPGLRAAFDPPWWKVAGARLLRVLAPRTGVAHGLPLQGLSRDPEVLARYEDDPLVHGVMSPRLYFGLREAQARVLAAAPALRVPALVLAGTADPIVDWTVARDFVSAAPSRLATFVPIEGAYHEILNDLARPIVLAHILSPTSVPD
jgi:alpha-beta hydrolase superfamily lysophospholipase